MEDSAGVVGTQNSVAMVVVGCDDEEEDEKYFISVNAYKVIVEESGSSHVMLGIIDAGSNIQFAPLPE